MASRWRACGLLPTIREGNECDSKVPAFVPLIVLLPLLGAAQARAQTNPPADAMIIGESADDDFGWRVAPAGDVNGDGAPDLIVGAPSNDAVAGFAGRAYLFYGPITGNLNAANADAIVTAEAFGDNLGFSVASAGDVNDDGFDDVLIGARSNDTPGIQAGRVYLFLGPLSGNRPGDVRGRDHLRRRLRRGGSRGRPRGRPRRRRLRRHPARDRRRG